MKKFVMIATVGAALALTACSSNKTADYAYEKQAPYATERTQGDAVTTTRADNTFSKSQNK